MPTVAQQAVQHAPVRDNKRPQLLDSAARNFCEHGYNAASMRDIAAAAGMKAGSMYYYFASKEDLLVAVHEEGIDRITDAVTQAITGVDGSWRRLQAAMGAHLQALLGGGDYARVVIKTLPNEGTAARRRLITLRDDYEAIFVRLIDDLPVSEGLSRRHMRLLVLGAMNWSQSWYRPDGDDPGAIAEAFVQIIRRGDSP